jgi:hypothetical protein
MAGFPSSDRSRTWTGAAAIADNGYLCIEFDQSKGPEEVATFFGVVRTCGTCPAGECPRMVSGPLERTAAPDG